MNQAMEFGLIFAGGFLLTSALTGSSLSDIAKGHPGSIGTSGQTLASSSVGAVAANGVAGVGQAATGILAQLFPGNSVTIKRQDQGRDLQAPANTPVHAPGAGYLVRNGSDPAGFGDSYPIVHFTSGPWAGQDVYIGHTMSLLPAGSQFKAGEPIALTQNGRGPYVGNAAGLPGWLEVGLAPGGNPGRFGQPLPAGL